MRLDRQQHPTAERNGTDRIECAYRNGSDRMVIVRCCGPHAFFLERVVFPFEMLLFSCPPESELEIWTHGLGGAELIEALQAEELQLENTAGENAGGAEAEEAMPWWAQAG